jgi:hypothetical protein
LDSRGIQAFYSFSERVSSEVMQEDGTVRKVNIFAHMGWIPVE